MKLQLGPFESELKLVPQNIQSLITSTAEMIPEINGEIQRNEVKFCYQDSEGDEIALSEDEDLFDIQQLARQKGNKQVQCIVRVTGNTKSRVDQSIAQSQFVEAEVKVDYVEKAEIVQKVENKSILGSEIQKKVDDLMQQQIDISIEKLGRQLFSQKSDNKKDNRKPLELIPFEKIHCQLVNDDFPLIEIYKFDEDIEISWLITNSATTAWPRHPLLVSQNTTEQIEFLLSPGETKKLTTFHKIDFQESQTTKFQVSYKLVDPVSLKPWSPRLIAIIVCKVAEQSPSKNQLDLNQVNRLLADVDSDNDSAAINMGTEVDEEEIKRYAKEDSKDKDAIEQFNRLLKESHQLMNDESQDLNDRSDTEVNLNKAEAFQGWRNESSLADLDNEDLQKARDSTRIAASKTGAAVNVGRRNPFRAQAMEDSFQQEENQRTSNVNYGQQQRKSNF